MADHPSLEEVVEYLVSRMPNRLTLDAVAGLILLAEEAYRERTGRSLCDVAGTPSLFPSRVTGCVGAMVERGELQLIAASLGDDPPPRALNEALAPSYVAGEERRVLWPGTIAAPSASATLTRLRRDVLDDVIARHERWSRDQVGSPNAQRSSGLGISPERPTRFARRRLLIRAQDDPGVVALRGRSAMPDTRSWGDPELSAAEDAAILQEMAALRHQANREID